MQIERLIHVHLNCSDLDRSVDFYTRVLGGKVAARSEKPDSAFLDAMGLKGNHAHRAAFIEFPKHKNFPVLDLLEWKQPGASQPLEMKDRGIPRIAIQVDDVDQAYAELLEEGADVLGPPQELGVAKLKMRAFFLRDPDGILIELLTYIR